MKLEIHDYDELVAEATNFLGVKNDSPLVARFIATKLVERGKKEGDPQKYVPKTIKELLAKVQELKWEGSILKS